jgi:uncharacterized protein
MNVSRRDFLKQSALLAGATTLPQTISAAEGSKTEPNKMQYRTLGRTGLKVSEVGFGAYPVKDPSVILYALDQGMNYFDTANCYPAESELTLGEALKGKRDRAIITTKWCPHHVGKPATKENFIAQLDESLKRLQTDYVDVVLNHQIGPSDKVTKGTNFERLENPELWEAWETVKKAGKARFIGASGHEGNLMEVMNYIVDSGKFDVILCRYSFLNYPTEPDLIKKCAEKNIGFVAMKTLAGAKGANVDGFRDKFTSYKQAALKWVLSNPHVSNLVISISDKNQVDEYVAASGKEMNRKDGEMLGEYRQRFSSEVCRFGSDCEPACPHDVRIADILRSSMYFHDYREEKHGIVEYAALPAESRAQHCVDCPAPCEKECPHHLPIKKFLTAAHGYLSMTAV